MQLDRGRMAAGGVGPGGPGHALARTSNLSVTEVRALPRTRAASRAGYYRPVGLPLPSARLHHRLIRAVFARPGRADGSLHFRTRPCARAAPPTPEGPHTRFGTKGVGPGLRREMSGSAPSLCLCRGCRTRPVDLRPASLLPPMRLSTPRSARRLSATNRGLLPGAPTPTRAGLAPAGLIQLRGRTIAGAYPATSCGGAERRCGMPGRRVA
jgi:hypothetical protein